MSPPLLTLLHLSDLRFGQGVNGPTSFDQKLLYSSLLEDARLMMSTMGSPQLVLLTGDITYSGQSSQFQEAEAKLEALLCTLGCQRDQLLTVPGNHDVDRGFVTEHLEGWDVHEIMKLKPDKVNTYLHPAHRSLLEAHILPKLRAYRQFAGGTCSLDSESTGWTTNAAEPWQAIGLNTCLLSIDDGEGPGLVGNILRHRLALGDGQRAILERIPPETLLIVLMHHPPSWLMDGNGLLSALETRPHLLFSAHEPFCVDCVPLVSRHSAAPHFIAGVCPRSASAGIALTYAWARLTGEGLLWYPRAWSEARGGFGADPRFELDEGGRRLLPRRTLPAPLARWLDHGLF